MERKLREYLYIALLIYFVSVRENDICLDKIKYYISNSCSFNIGFDFTSISQHLCGEFLFRVSISYVKITKTHKIQKTSIEVMLLLLYDL